MNRPIYAEVIHVEGMDLAGKSTATAYLVANTGGALQRNSLVPDNPMYLKADELRRNEATPDLLGPMYVQALEWDLNRVTRGGPRIQDSTILLRSLAFYEVLGHTDIVRHLSALIPRHPRFGLTIVLTASIEARVLRLAERQRLAPEEVAPDDLMVVKQPELFKEMERVLLLHAIRHFDSVELDNSSFTKTDTRNAIDRLMRAAGFTAGRPA